MPIARLMLVDDEWDLVWAVRRSLSHEGYEVFTAYDGLEALALARRAYPDLIILDIVMPRLDGLEVCRMLRREPGLAAVPILFLSVRSAIEDRIRGLDEGGDDYLVKPFELGELKARIRALLRRSQRATRDAQLDEQGYLVMGSLTLDLGVRQACVGERRAQLTPTEFDLLKYLMKHPGKLFSSKQLLLKVWGYPLETADLSLVRWHIRNLRSKIEPDPTHPMYIRTVPRQGYVLDEHLPSRPETAQP